LIQISDTSYAEAQIPKCLRGLARQGHDLPAYLQRLPVAGLAASNWPRVLSTSPRYARLKDICRSASGDFLANFRIVWLISNSFLEEDLRSIELAASFVYEAQAVKAGA
jgi:hypothetical protein